MNLIKANYYEISTIFFKLSTHFETNYFIFHFFLDMIYFIIIRWNRLESGSPNLNGATSLTFLPRSGRLRLDRTQMGTPAKLIVI